MVKRSYITTYQVSRYCEVYVSTVANWIKSGKLAAYKTPGGHHRIRRTDLIKFMKEYSMPIPEDLKVGKEARILVVDDNVDFLEMIESILHIINPKYKVVTATTGFEAGKRMVEMLPDLVLLDIYLPGLDGFEVCTNIRNDSRTKETKILAITGDLNPDIKKRILACGANDIVYKPITASDIKDKIYSMLEIYEII